MKTCECGTSLAATNKSGRCASCYWNTDPVSTANRVAMRATKPKPPTLDERMQAFSKGFTFEGKRLEDLAALAGETVPATRKWLNARGYNTRDRVVRMPALPQRAEDEIRERIASAPPSGPCWRCGAAKSCEHR